MDVKDKNLLMEIELYLYSQNKRGMNRTGRCVSINLDCIDDAKAMELYFKLYALIENLKNEGEK